MEFSRKALRKEEEEACLRMGVAPQARGYRCSSDFDHICRNELLFRNVSCMLGSGREMN